MKTYHINKYAERFAREVAVTPELVYSISLVQFQAKNCRCIAAWTPGMTRPPPVCLQGTYPGGIRQSYGAYPAGGRALPPP